MKPIAVEVGNEMTESPLVWRKAMPSTTVSRFWLRTLFWLSRKFPEALRLFRRPVAWAAVRCSGPIRRGTFANARRILGRDISKAQCMKFAAEVVGNFYDFVVDVACSSGQSAEGLAGRIESVEGHDEYLETRRGNKGAIILTAHMGSFEIGMAALAERESHIHVVFKRDALNGFEALRQTLRQSLGIMEAAIDDGWHTWVKLRDALENNQVVLMQGDRAMPGQRSQSVPMFGAHLPLPLGPIKLAQITGSPIIPVMVIKTAGGRFRIFVQPAIEVDPIADHLDRVHPQLLEWARVIEKFVAEYPEQWLILEPAFTEDMTKAS